MGVIGELPGCDFAKDDTERENVCGEIKLFAQEDFGGHVRVGAAKGKTFGFFSIPSGDSGKTKVCDFDTSVGGDEEVFAFEIAVDALSGVEVCEGTSDICCKGYSESPGKGF